MSKVYYRYQKRLLKPLRKCIKTIEKDTLFRNLNKFVLPVPVLVILPVPVIVNVIVIVPVIVPVIVIFPVNVKLP